MDLESLKLTKAYILTTWIVFIFSVLTYGIGLFNAELQLNEKGFFAVTYVMALFSSIVVQKNTRDVEYIKEIKNK